MAPTEYYWAVIGGVNGGAVYNADECPFIACGRRTPPLPLAIQCTSENEASQVVRTLQTIVNSLPHDADHTQLLAAFDVPAVRTLLEDEAGFHAVVIGSPPGIHRTAKSARRAEGTFKYPICKHTSSFWIALAFLVVKGLPQNMPPLETIANVPENTVDTSYERLHDSSGISPRSSQTASALRLSHSTSSTPASISHASAPLSQFLTVLPSIPSPSSGPEILTSQPDLSPIIYSHVRNLRGIISSHHYPMSTTNEQNMGRQLGTLASHYLASHGYSAEDISAIVEAYRCVGSNDQLVMFLARRGMAVSEARFLLVLIDLRDSTCDTCDTYDMCVDETM